MNEAETRAEHIDPALKTAGWGVVAGSRIRREYPITLGRLESHGRRGKSLSADYVLEYRNHKLAVIEAKAWDSPLTEGVAQAKDYAGKLAIRFTYATNGQGIYGIDMQEGTEGEQPHYPTPEELWQMTFATQNNWRDRFASVPFEDRGGYFQGRYYQDIAIERVLEAIADGHERILLTLATGTGKTFIAFQLAWKLFHSRWNLSREPTRRPRILFLADRNILANQAYNAFSAFPEDALVRIEPGDIKKKGKVPKNGSLFFTIFQTFMSGPGDSSYFGEYPPDFFDLIIIDECHRGGANDESTWRDILKYFAPAVQLGLTATPKRKDNVDTYAYFGDPVYLYSLKEGINDGFLTPFKVRRMKTSLDEYIYTSDDMIIEGEIEEGKVYKEADFNRIIEIKAREAKRVQLFMDEINQNEKGIVFCATQDHAAAVRDLINQYKKNPDPMYCVRVTANDAALGEEYLRQFQDNERTIPTILTTSQKLSTGVDARNIRNIILMRPINSMIEFKQIIGRGTRLFDGKEYFTIYDFVDAHHHFADPEWDGDPEEPPIEKPPKTPKPPVSEPPEPYEPKIKVKIKLRDGKEREIQHMSSTLFYSADGRPISAQQFLENLFGVLPAFFKSEAELRILWSNPITRKVLLDQLEQVGFGAEELSMMQSLINAENSDLFDVLEYVSFVRQPITREKRVANAQSKIFAALSNEQKQFVEFVLSKYIETGVEELDQEKLPHLLTLKYQALDDAKAMLGTVETIRNLFVGFQRFLYEQGAPA